MSEIWASRAATPEAFIAEFFTSFTEAALGDEPPADVVDRYYTPDLLQVSDGLTFDRERIISHLGPLRRNLLDCRFEVHEALADGPRIAARYTIHSRMRKAGPTVIDVQLIAELTPDGRMRRVHQLTRDVPPA